MVTVTLENVTHVYVTGKIRTVAVRNVNLTFDHGGFYGILGPSGCGKTTLMRIIAGLIKPTQGRVLFDGNDVTGWPPKKRNVAMVFQFPVVYDMSVYDNIAFPLRNFGYGEDEIRRRVYEIAELMGIRDLLNANAVKLDAASRQKVAVARALVRDPTVFLFDEPLTNLDPLSRLELRSKLKELQRRVKTTMIYVTHDQAEVLTLADKIAVMNEGVVIQFDEPQRLYEYPKNTFVGYFIGNPGMNFFDCTLGDSYADCSDFKVQIGRELIEKVGVGGRVKLGIRPEFISVDKSGGDAKGKIVVREDLGTAVVLHVSIGSYTVKVKLPQTTLREGDEVYLVFPKEKIRIFDERGDLIA